jgi:hypothetical protein
MAVSPATDSAVRADSGVEAFLVGEIMAASLIAVSGGAVAAFVIVVFATLMGALSALDIRTITHTLFTGLFWILRSAELLTCVVSPIGFVVKTAWTESALKPHRTLFHSNFDYPRRRPGMHLPCVIERRGCDVSREPHLYKDISVSKSRT